MCAQFVDLLAIVYSCLQLLAFVHVSGYSQVASHGTELSSAT